MSNLVAAGLWDPHNDAHMGNCAELCAQHYQISRQEMDDHAIEAFQRAQAAAPFMTSEVVAVTLPPSKGSPQGKVLDYDESLSKIDESKLRGLKPYFKQVGSGSQNLVKGGSCKRNDFGVLCLEEVLLLMQAFRFMWDVGGLCSTSQSCPGA